VRTRGGGGCLAPFLFFNVIIILAGSLEKVSFMSTLAAFTEAAMDEAKYKILEDDSSLERFPSVLVGGQTKKLRMGVVVY